MRIPAPEIETLVCARLAELFDDPIRLIEKTAASAAPPDVTAKAVSGSCAIAEALRGSDTTSIARLIDRIVPRIDVAADAVTIVLDSQRVAESLGIDGPANSASLQITVPAKLKRSGMAMRLVLETGQAASARVDDNLVKAIATAHRWWEELLQNPELRISDLAKSHGLTKSWITRTLRLAFLDPAITEMILAGKAPAHLTQQVLRSEGSIPPLWSAQRTRHRISAAI